MEFRRKSQFTFDVRHSNFHIDIAVEQFTKAIHEAEESSVPKSSPYRFRFPYSSNLNLLTKYRNHCRNKYKRTLEPVWKSLMNQANRMIKSETSKLNQSSFSDRLASLRAADGSLYSFVKALKNKKSSLPPLKKPDNSLVYSNRDKAQTLADGFLKCHQVTHDLVSPVEGEVADSCQKLASYKNRLFPVRAEKSQHDLRPVSRSGNLVTLDSVGGRRTTKFKESYVVLEIKALKVKKASGPDKLSNRVLKRLPKLAVLFMTKLFNSCWALAYFPHAWKISKVVAIPKQGKDPTVPTNYRPISLISNVGKLYERLILGELEYHESLNDIFIPQQFGFRTKHSTDQQILRITEKATIGFNKKRSTGLVLLDLEKAFDSVWHDGLLHKLLKNDYPIHLVLVIQSFLSERQAFVDVQNNSSSRFTLPAGVPQGSLLSPHLFNIFINDIDLPENCELAIYADDTALFCDVPWKNHSQVSKKLTKAVSTVSNFFNRWKIKLNTSKTEFTVFTRSTKMKSELIKHPPVLNGTQLEWKPSVIYLGVELDQRLAFKNHIERVINKAKNMRRNLFCLLKRNNTVDVKTKVMIYRAIIRPIMTYACPIFTNCPKKHFERLQIEQNICLRMALNDAARDNKRTRIVDLHERAKIPTIREFVNKLTASFYERSENHQSPLINNLGTYTAVSLGVRVKHKLPRHIQ